MQQLSHDYGKTRLAFVKSCQSEEDWDQWAEPKHQFAFQYGPCWKNTIEYKVSDFAAEVGFFIDVLGCDCNALMEDYAMIQGPEQEFTFSFRPAKNEEAVTPKDAITIEFMVSNIDELHRELISRGIEFIQSPQEESGGQTAKFQTPHGITIKLWCFS